VAQTSRKTGRVEWVEDLLAGYYERTGKFPAGTMTQGFVSHVPLEDGHVAVWTHAGGAVSSPDPDLAAGLSALIANHDPADHMALFPAWRDEIDRPLSGAKCFYFAMLYWAPGSGHQASADPRIVPLGVEDIWTNNEKEPPEFRHILGIRDGDTVASWAFARPMFDVYGDTFHSVGARTHESYRRRGLGKSVVLAILDRIAEDGTLATWECRADNVPSYKLAMSCGFVEYAWTLMWNPPGKDWR